MIPLKDIVALIISDLQYTIKKFIILLVYNKLRVHEMFILSGFFDQNALNFSVFTVYSIIHRYIQIWTEKQKKY